VCVQFRFLERLLLVHGSQSYHRISVLILYSFYKNVTITLTQVCVCVCVMGVCVCVCVCEDRCVCVEICM